MSLRTQLEEEKALLTMRGRLTKLNRALARLTPEIEQLLLDAGIKTRT